jgi:hypothetical protein
MSSHWPTAQEILDRNQAVAAAEVRAAEDPSTLTDDDLKILPGEITSRLMTEGKLAHLGLGRPRHGPRPRMRH